MGYKILVKQRGLRTCDVGFDAHCVREVDDAGGMVGWARITTMDDRGNSRTSDACPPCASGLLAAFPRLFFTPEREAAR